MLLGRLLRLAASCVPAQLSLEWTETRCNAVLACLCGRAPLFELCLQEAQGAEPSFLCWEQRVLCLLRGNR